VRVANDASQAQAIDGVLEMNDERRAGRLAVETAPGGRSAAKSACADYTSEGVRPFGCLMGATTVRWGPAAAGPPAIADADTSQALALPASGVDGYVELRVADGLSAWSLRFAVRATQGRVALTSSSEVLLERCDLRSLA
jgi:hypothetical protein